MAELVAEAFLTAVFEKLFEKLTSREFVNFFRGKKSIDDQLRELNLKLKMASLLLNDAEERQLDDSNVKKWLDELKDVIYRAQDLVEEVDYEARAKKERESESNARSLMMKVKSFVPSIFTEFDKAVQGEIAKILDDLNILLDKRVVLGLKEDDHKNINTSSSSSLKFVAPLREESHVHGRDADKEDMVKLLLSDHDVWGNEIGVVPIVGMGGLGKTTLAHLVYDDSRLKEHHFELKAWVTVSTEFDVFRIIKVILQQVGPNSGHVTEEPMELQCKLKEALRGKKFFFVLDDVWDEEYDNWDILKSNFSFGERGSRIIVTTRSSKVAAVVRTGPIHELQQVSYDHCWQIFVDHAFNGDCDADQHLQEIGRRIVEKCRGLPLAVKSLGGLLRFEKDPRKWESILRSHVWEWCRVQSNKILPSLWLSYRYLPSCLKQCFSYCSIFPKDYEFQKHNIILLWMAQGFLQSHEKGKSMEEVGDEYFNDLLSRSLFQRSSTKDESKFVMHDLVHDLAMFVSREFCFALDDNKNVKLLTSKTRHVSLNTSIDYEYLSKGLFEAKHLRSFIQLKRYFSDPLFDTLIEKGRCLRVLSLDCWMVPDSLSNLKNLRYLNLSGIHIIEIPSSICILYNLQTLLFSNCRELTRLPNDMGKLINLRHLDTSGCPLKEMPPQMGNLKELRTLTDFVLGESQGSSIKELGELQHLSGRISISGLQNVDNIEDVLAAELRNKANLSSLALNWEGDTNDTRREKEVLEALRPHTNLKSLSIWSYSGTSFPNWIGDPLFSNIVSMNLRTKNEYCWFLPPLGQLPFLRELVIEGFHGVETVGAEFYGNNSSITPFQSLESLSFGDMPKWNRWLFSRDDKEGGSFPCLKQLVLNHCPNLTERSLPDSDTVEYLTISDSYKFMESLPLDQYPRLNWLTLYNCENLKELIMDIWDVIETLIIESCNKLVFPGNHRYVSIRDLTIATSSDLLMTFPLDCFPRLKELTLWKCTNLESITVFSEENGSASLQSTLSTLTLNGCKNLRSLPQDMHRLLPSLAKLEIYNCPEMESFPQGGLPSNLNSLRICDCSKLIAQHKHWDLHGLTSLKSLDISECDVVLDSFPEGLLPISLTSFRLYYLPHLKSLNGNAFQHVASLHGLVLWNCNELQCLPEQVLRPTFLHTLSSIGCPILERRYQRGKGEDWHKISHIPKLLIFK